MTKKKISGKVYHLNKKVAVFYHNRTRYDLQSAVLIAEYWNEVPSSDPAWYKENLFVTEKNNFVLLGIGNRETKYGRRKANGDYVSGRKYMVQDRLAAYDYLEKHQLLDDVLVNTYFFDLVKDG